MSTRLASTVITITQIVMIVALVLANAVLKTFPLSIVAFTSIWLIAHVVELMSFRRRDLLVGFHPQYKLWPGEFMSLGA